MHFTSQASRHEDFHLPLQQRAGLCLTLQYQPALLSSAEEVTPCP